MSEVQSTIGMAAVSIN